MELKLPTMQAERNCWMVIKRALEYFVGAATVRSVPHNLKLMQVGPHVKNPIHTFTHQMECHYMNWQFLYPKAVNILLGIMTTSAVFVEMVAIFCFVMDALGPFTEYVHLYQAFPKMTGTVDIARTCSNEKSLWSITPML